jgi:hypothetical protein
MLFIVSFGSAQSKPALPRNKSGFGHRAGTGIRLGTRESDQRDLKSRRSRQKKRINI